MMVIVIRFNFLYTLINRRVHIELCVFGTIDGVFKLVKF